jgi:hypothetical protein
LRIYEIKYRCFVKPTEEEMLEYDLESDAIREVQDIFHLGAFNLLEAVGLSIDHLEEIFEENEYDIISTTELAGVNVINWAGENDGCPICQAKDAPPEDTIDFLCTCGKTIKVMNEGWESVQCHDCSKEIYRDRIIGSNGHYILLDIDKEK